MKIKYYGTAAAEGWPGLFCRCEACEEARRRGGRNIRTRSQATIDDKLLVDFPPDTYLHTLYGGLDLPKFTSCIITHAHEDHLYPQDLGMRVEGYCENVVPGPFTLYGGADACALLDALPEWAKQPERVAWKEVVEYRPFEVEGYTVTPLLAAHGKHDGLKCYIYMIEKDGKRLLYGNDTGNFPKETWDYIAGRHFDLVSLDCTMLTIKEGTNHMGIEDVLEVRQRMLDLDCADDTTVWVITHFSHNGGLLHEELEAKMKEYGILVAYDGFEAETR